MIPFLDTYVTGFLIVTVLLACGAACLMGQALAATWRPRWQMVAYSLMLGLADRFMNFALFDGLLLSGTGYAVDTLIVLVAASVSYRITQVSLMTRQYPWLYERAGLFDWREIGRDS